MKKTIIERYEKTEKNEIIIDVSINTVENLYHNFDKTAPYYRKELDQELVDYLTECVDEIGNHPFVIRFSFEKMPDEQLMGRVRKSLNSYYVYLREIEIRSLKFMFRQFIVLFGVGLILLVLAILATRRSPSHQSVIAEVFAQGLTIAAWVSLWESVVKIFLEWRPHRKTIRLYNRVIDSQIIFRCCQ